MLVRWEEVRPNATPVHVEGEDSTWVSIGEVLNQAPDYWAGGHGMYGPPSDYIKFEQALLRGGELGGPPDLAAVHGGPGFPQPDRRP